MVLDAQGACRGADGRGARTGGCGWRRPSRWCRAGRRIQKLVGHRCLAEVHPGRERSTGQVRPQQTVAVDLALRLRQRLHPAQRRSASTVWRDHHGTQGIGVYRPPVGVL